MLVGVQGLKVGIDGDLGFGDFRSGRGAGGGSNGGNVFLSVTLFVRMTDAVLLPLLPPHLLLSLFYI